MLSAFQPLFKQSVRDLEHAAHAQQQYQRQMHECAQQQSRPVNGANGPTTSPSRMRTTYGYPAAKQFFEDRDAAHAQLQQQPLYTVLLTCTRPVTTSATLASPASIVEDVCALFYCHLVPSAAPSLSRAQHARPILRY